MGVGFGIGDSPMPLSSQMARASAAGAGVGVGVAVEVSVVVGASTTISVGVQPSSTVSMVRLGPVHGVPAFQADLDGAVYLPVLVQVWEPLGGTLVWPQVTGDAGVRFRRSDANSVLTVRLLVGGSISWGV